MNAEQNPLVSIIIPCYNAEKWVAEAIQAALDQTYRPIEVIVIDDGSTDGSLEVIKSFGERIRYETGPNRGASAARNTGTAIARGEFIQYLDADDLLAPDKLQLQVQALESSGADVASGDWKYLSTQPDGSFIAGQTVRGGFSGDPQIALFVGWCAPHSYLYMRHIVERIGGWNVRLPVIQDARFAWDAAYHGARFVYVPGALVYYRMHPGPTSLSTRSHIAFHRDIFTNATEVEALWRGQGDLSSARLRALRQVYGYVARATYLTDTTTFEQAYTALRRLSPNHRYVPESPRHLALASRLLGYPRAEWLASRYRDLKMRLKRAARFAHADKVPAP